MPLTSEVVHKEAYAFFKRMNKKTLLFFFFVLIQNTYAVNWYVNDNSTSGDIFCTAVGNNSNSGLTPALPKLTLSAAIAAATNGDTIYIDKGTFISQTHTINKQLTILGAGNGNTVFDGNNTAINFGSITASNVTIKNLKLTRYFLDSSTVGQVLNISGAITGVLLENVMITNNLGGTLSLPNINISGGANVTIKNSFLKCSGNNATSGGGIKVSASTLSVQNILFYQCENSGSGTMGGALWVNGASNVNVSNCTFTSNIGRNGGAIGQDGGTLTVTGSCFSDNMSESDASTDGGGAIFVTGTTTTSISNCTFSNNRVTNNGVGATTADGCAVKFNSVTGTFSISTCTFTNNGKTLAGTNVAFDRGQDIYLDETAITGSSITNCTFQAPIAGEVNLQNNDLEQADIATITFCAPIVLGGGTTLSTNGSAPISSAITNCYSTSAITSCSVAVNCATDNKPPLIINCVANKTLTCPAVMPNYTSELAFYDDCTATVTQSIAAGTLLTAGNYNITMTVTDQNNNFSTCNFTLTVSGMATPAANYGEYASAISISTNGGTSSTFYNTSGSGGNLIGVSTFAGTNLGTHNSNSATLKLTGAELKTYKNGSANVCGGTMYYTIYQSGSRPAIPTFSTFAIPFKANCGSGVFTDGQGPCNTGDQKWSTVAQTIDLTTQPVGNYTIEVFYNYSGSDTGGGCGTTQYINNSCNNYIATFTIGNTCIPPSISVEPISTQTVCKNITAANITLSATGTGLTYQWYSNASNSNSGGTGLGSSNGAQTATYTPSTSTLGTIYYYCVITGTCGSTTSATSAVIVPESSWNGTTWSNGDPTIETTVTFTGNYTSSSDLSACTLHVSNGANVTIATGFDCTVHGAVSVDGDSSLTFENNSNLLQETNAVNTGNISMKRNTNPLMRLDYTIWSAPVTGQNLLSFSPNTLTDRFYTYNTSTNLYNPVNPSSTSFTPGAGYQIRVPNNHPTSPTIWTGTFTGIPNNGNYTVPLTNIGAGQRFNIVGNPYPSPIDMNTFASVNSNNITGTIYFWRKTNSTITSNRWSTWNSGTFVASPGPEPYVSNPNDIIRNGQGFLVEAKAAGTSLDFNNSMRVSDNSNQFFRLPPPPPPLKSRIWLNVTTTEGAFCQQAVSYIQDGTNNVDDADALNLNNTELLFTSIIPGSTNRYTIQSREVPFSADDAVLLSLKTPIAGIYTISIDHKDGLFADNMQDIFIKDNYNNTYINLNNGVYSFVSNTGIFDDRFELRFVDSMLNTDESTFTASSVIVYNTNQQIIVNSQNELIDTINIYDITGRLLFTKDKIAAKEFRFNLHASKEVLLVHIIPETGKRVIKKLIH